MPQQTLASQRKKRRSSKEVNSRILEAAAAEFELAGYAGATTAAIAERADVTESQIFRLYRTKQELFRAAIFAPLIRHFELFRADHVLDDNKVEPTRQVARQYIIELKNFVEEHSRMIISLIVRSIYSPNLTGGVNELEGLRTYFDQGSAVMAKRSEGHGTIDPQLMVRVSFAAVLANLIFKDWLFPKDIADDDAIREAIIGFVIGGLGATLGTSAVQTTHRKPRRRSLIRGKMYKIL